MEILENQKDGVVIIEIEGELNLMSAETVKECFEKYIKQKSYRIILDFLKLEFLDSTGIGLIIEMSNRLKQLNGNLVIVNMNSDVKNLFGIANLLEILKHFKTMHEAEEFFQK